MILIYKNSQYDVASHQQVIIPDSLPGHFSSVLKSLNFASFELGK